MVSYGADLQKKHLFQEDYQCNLPLQWWQHDSSECLRRLVIEPGVHMGLNQGPISLTLNDSR